MSGYESGCSNLSSQPPISDSEVACSTAERAGGASETMRRTSRYRRRDGVRRPGTRKLEEILLTVHRYRIVDREIIQTLHFTPAGKSAAQRALTNLWWSKHLDKLPGRPINARDAYVLSGKAPRGLKVLERHLGPDLVRTRLVRPPSVDHALAVNGFRARVENSARRQGFDVEDWRDELDLAHLAGDHIVPDAFFSLSRQVSGKRLRSGFCLEVELAPVGRARWRRRLEAYAEFYYSKRYEAVFGMSSFRLLAVVRTGGRQLEVILDEAERVKFSPLRVSVWSPIETEADGLLVAPLWRRSGAYGPEALFTRATTA